MSKYSTNTAKSSGKKKQDRNSLPGTGVPAALRVISKNGVSRLFADPNNESMEALAELKTNGFSRESGNGLTLEDKCEEVISSLGFTMVEAEELSPGLDNLKNYSLRGSTNVDETIENSKIMDPDLNKLTPVKGTSTDKFKSAADSFYELDEERSEPIKKIMKKEKQNSKKVSLKLSKSLAQVTRKSPNKMLHKTNKRSLKR